MKRFEKIKGPKPRTTSEISTLSKPNFVWGTRFICHQDQRDVSWICNQSGILAFIEVGRVTIRSETGSLVLSPGTLTFIPPEYPYLEQRMGVRTTGWYISLPKIKCKRFPKTALNLVASDLILAVSERIVSLSSRELLPSNWKNLVAILLDELQRAESTRELTIPTPHSQKLRQVAEQIIAMPSDMQKIDAWAKLAGMSRRSFTRSFTEETGLSFAVWRRRVKLSAAVEGFRAGKSIDNISFDLGYQNPSTFISTFKKHFGASPARYLKLKTSASPKKNQKRSK